MVVRRMCTASVTARRDLIEWFGAVVSECSPEYFIQLSLCTQFNKLWWKRWQEKHCAGPEFLKVSTETRMLNKLLTLYISLAWSSCACIAKHTGIGLFSEPKRLIICGWELRDSNTDFSSSIVMSVGTPNYYFNSTILKGV